MLAISLIYLFPSYFAAISKRPLLDWAIGVDLKQVPEQGNYGVRGRLFGVNLSIEWASPEKLAEFAQKTEIKQVSETKITKNGAKSSEILASEMPSDTQKWITDLMSKGFKYVITTDGVYDAKDNSFKLPKVMGSVVIEIGDAIAFGDQKQWVGAKVTGSRETEDGQVVYYTRQLKS